MDAKWRELESILDDPIMLDAATGVRRKIIIFTEPRDTLEYLAQKPGGGADGLPPAGLVASAALPVAPVMRALEPFARDLWDSDIAAWLPEDAASATQVRYYFFGRLDQMLTLTRPAASITSTGLTCSRANLHEPLLHSQNEVAASVIRRSPAAAHQKRARQRWLLDSV
jgi:hypothetical protein